MNEIKFLHLSDLHIGDSNQKGMLSQMKSILFEDIEFILTKIESLDVVFFTGDLVQKGTKEEFALLEKFLIELWAVFSKCHQNPELICVPGNHDLERVGDIHNPTQKILNNWIGEDIKEAYFWKSPNVYHDFINERFANYLEWYKNTSIRKSKNIFWGYIPGDFYCSIDKDDLKLGVVGLNSSFLQLTGADAERKLGVYNKQIHSLFDEQYSEWLKSNDLSVLLTHHSPDWFEPDALEEYHQEIYINDSCLEHICGHMHEPSSSNISMNGYPSKRTFVAPSLFGLEYYGEKQRLNRIHGYSAGIYREEAGRITKTIWPRISRQTKSNGIKIIQNDEFNLDKDSLSFSEVLRETDSDVPESKNDDDGESIEDIEKKGGNLFGGKKILDKSLIRTQYKVCPSHVNVRLSERMSAVGLLKKQKFCWIITKFGLGEDEFLGSILGEADINPENCFTINCDEISTIDDLINSFDITFSHNITKFFDIINSLDRPLVVFNKLNSSLVKLIAEFNEFISTVFDFSPNVKVAIISTFAPERQFFDFVRLYPLDIPAVKQFVENSQDLHTSFSFLEFEKIHRLSSGIPLYLDKVIQQLEFRSLSDLGDMEFETSTNEEVDEILDKSMINEISILQSDETTQSNRRFSLLSLLSLLHNGETFGRVRRFNPTKPFHHEDISYLLKNKLIETGQVNSIFNDKQIDSELIKIIKVPREIRDYVSSLIENEDKLDIYKQICNLYLGDNWRTTIKFIKSIDVELDLVIHQNLQIAIRFILAYGVENDMELEISRMTRISLALIKYFEGRGAYKDAISLAEETLLLIKDVDRVDFVATRTFLTRKLGENLRMSSNHERSIKILKSICDDETNTLNKADRNDIRLSIAYAYSTLDKKDEAINYANLIKKNNEDVNSNNYLSAESVIAEFVTDEIDKVKRLNSIKRKADKFGFKVLSANIVLDICRVSKEEKNIKQLDKIIRESKNDTYNKVRAWAAKAEIVLDTKKISEITIDDLMGLNISYTYSFYQRIQSLLNKCHRLAWKYWSSQDGFDQLLNLFRYSSFVWRLCGAQDREKVYVDLLHDNERFIAWFKLNKGGVNSRYYEQRIFALYNNGGVKLLE